MATRYAVATGNWSATATWDGGTLPASTDDVYADGKTVTIDQDVTVLSIRNQARSGGSAGGSFTLNSGYTVTANVYYNSNTGACINYAGTGTSSIVGSVYCSTNAALGNTPGITHSGSGTLNLTGNLGLGTGVNAIDGAFVRVSAGGTFNLVGNISLGSSTATLKGVDVTGAGVVNVTGSVTACSASSSGYGISISGAAVVTVTGAVTGGTVASNYGIGVTNVSASLTVNGTLTTSAVAAVYASVAATMTLTGPFISSTSGILPMFTPGAVILSPISSNEFRFRKTVSGTLSLYSSDVTSGAPAVGNVRAGTSYGGGTLTGTLAVPNPAYVAAGVATDNTVGTYDPATTFWEKATSTSFPSGSMGERLKNVSTVDSTGAQIASYGA